ncbi:MAG: hypothetical protein ACREM1_15045 [Longimicrobiales bacterium]
MSGGTDSLRITALSKGDWGNGLYIGVDYDGAAHAETFNLTITDGETGATNDSAPWDDGQRNHEFRLTRP